MTASYTSRRGTPYSSATRTASSYSGYTLSIPNPVQRLAATGPHGVSMEIIVLSRTVRSITAHRMPMVVVSSNTMRSILSLSSSSHITVRRQAGRLFFITIGEALASLAPSRRSLDIA